MKACSCLIRIPLSASTSLSSLYLHMENGALHTVGTVHLECVLHVHVVCLSSFTSQTPFSPKIPHFLPPSLPPFLPSLLPSLPPSPPFLPPHFSWLSLSFSISLSLSSGMEIINCSSFIFSPSGLGDNSGMVGRTSHIVDTICHLRGGGWGARRGNRSSQTEGAV